MKRCEEIPKAIVIFEECLANEKDSYNKTVFIKSVTSLNSTPNRKKITDVFFEYLQTKEELNKDEPPPKST